MQITPAGGSGISARERGCEVRRPRRIAQVPDCSTSCGRYELVVPLLPALPLEELVIPAGGELRVGLADLRTRIVHRAAARFGIEKHADAAVGLVFLVT